MNKRLSLGPRIDSLLDRLYERHSRQNEELAAYFAARAQEESFDWSNFDDRTNQFLSDKLIALDREKAEFCYHVCRALNAKRVIEAGTSYGVSTIYLASAVRDNVRGAAGQGVVIGTEYEPKKAEAARANFAEAGLTDFIDLREGDLRQTLVDPGGQVDFMLIDIWTPLVRPAIELIAPYLRTGAVIVSDNTSQFRESYREYFEFIGDPKNGLSTMTLPFEGGLEFTVRIS
jgi:predicted O-methyltransferase YrrM